MPSCSRKRACPLVNLVFIIRIIPQIKPLMSEGVRVPPLMVLPWMSLGCGGDTAPPGGNGPGLQERFRAQSLFGFLPRVWYRAFGCRHKLELAPSGGLGTISRTCGQTLFTNRCTTLQCVTVNRFI